MNVTAGNSTAQPSPITSMALSPSVTAPACWPARKLSGPQIAPASAATNRFLRQAGVRSGSGVCQEAALDDDRFPDQSDATGDEQQGQLAADPSGSYEVHESDQCDSCRANLGDTGCGAEHNDQPADLEY